MLSLPDASEGFECMLRLSYNDYPSPNYSAYELQSILMKVAVSSAPLPIAPQLHQHNLNGYFNVNSIGNRARYSSSNNRGTWRPRNDRGLGRGQGRGGSSYGSHIATGTSSHWRSSQNRRGTIGSETNQSQAVRDYGGRAFPNVRGSGSEHQSWRRVDLVPLQSVSRDTLEHANSPSKSPTNVGRGTAELPFTIDNEGLS